MAAQTTIPILQTKFHRPRVAEDIVCRKTLNHMLDVGRTLSFTLVSAPAGYGKSTLISNWIRTANIRNAWVSLDDGDSNLRVFLNYLYRAVQKIFPRASFQLEGLLTQLELPPLKSLVDCLVSDLSAIDEPFTLVLDDYHCIGSSSIVNESISELLKHPPQTLHLIICTRRDPHLPLANLRAKRLMNEIRMKDLAFTQQETSTFMEQISGQTLNSDALAQVHKVTEGWLVALHLTALVSQYHNDKNSFFSTFSGTIHHIEDYLISEVMEHEDPVIRDCLCKLSILNRFTSQLCVAVCSSEKDEMGIDQHGIKFQSLLQRSGLLTIALDTEQRWYRFHHLFQDLLHQQLKVRFSSQEINKLHFRAAEWLDAHGYLEEAVHHILHSGDEQTMRSMIQRYRRELFQKEKWVRIDALLNQLPISIVEKDPELLMAKVWISIKGHRDIEARTIFGKVQKLLENRSFGDTDQPLLGEIDVILCWGYYLKGEGEVALKYARSAVKRLPLTYECERGYAVMMEAVSLQMAGRKPEGLKLVYNTLEKNRQLRFSFRIRLLEALGYIYWMAGDMINLRNVGKSLLTHSNTEGLSDAITTGHYWVGMANYVMGDIEQAAQVVSTLFEQTYKNYNNFFVRATYVYSMSCELLGQSKQASEILDNTISYCMDTGDSYSVIITKGFQAELALRQGRMSDAESWLSTFEPSSTPMSYGATVAELTAVRILHYNKTTDSIEKATILLDGLNAYFRGIHNTRFLIETLVMQGLVFQAEGKQAEADSCLTEAVALAQPGNFVQVFIDCGSEVVPILNRLNLDEGGLHFAGRILKAVSSRKDLNQQRIGAIDTAEIHTGLSNREQEVLSCLAERLTNREIGERLFISPGTVKRHTHSIYNKLAVNSRQEAVAKAEGLGILNT